MKGRVKFVIALFPVCIVEILIYEMSIVLSCQLEVTCIKDVQTLFKF